MIISQYSLESEKSQTAYLQVTITNLGKELRRYQLSCLQPIAKSRGDGIPMFDGVRGFPRPAVPCYQSQLFAVNPFQTRTIPVILDPFANDGLGSTVRGVLSVNLPAISVGSREMQWPIPQGSSPTPTLITVIQTSFNTAESRILAETTMPSPSGGSRFEIPPENPFAKPFSAIPLSQVSEYLSENPAEEVGTLAGFLLAVKSAEEDATHADVLNGILKQAGLTTRLKHTCHS